MQYIRYTSAGGEVKIIQKFKEYIIGDSQL